MNGTGLAKGQDHSLADQNMGNLFLSAPLRRKDHNDL
jgi:hypothetical protein